jgi:hypothetical protein
LKFEISCSFFSGFLSKLTISARLVLRKHTSDVDGDSHPFFFFQKHFLKKLFFFYFFCFKLIFFYILLISKIIFKNIILIYF